MTNESSSKAFAPDHLEAKVSDDRLSVTLRITDEDHSGLTLEGDAGSIEILIKALGAARAEMLAPVTNDLAAGVLPLASYNPRWYVLPDTEGRFATFWIRHPGLGWSGFGFPRNEAGNIAKWLRKVTAVTSTSETHSSQASSFGGSSFLISTEGLGLYYYGEGEKRIGPNPFEQIEFDSDRAAGIVSASIAETRLEQALVSRLKSENTKVISNLFRPSGALGPFSVKIDMSYLLGIISDEAHKDLSIIKGIRNDFAHDFNLDSFDAPSIRDRCSNLAMIDSYVGPPPERIDLAADSFGLERKSKTFIGLPDYKEKLSDPRFRYTMTAQLISFELGQGSDNKEASLPLI